MAMFSFRLGCLLLAGMILLPRNGLSAGKQSLLIPNFSSPLFDPVENERLRGVLIRVSAKQEEFHLVFKTSTNPWPVSSEEPLLLLELRYQDLGAEGLGVIAAITRTEDEKFLKRVVKNGFSTEQLYRVTELALEVLFNLSAPEALEQFDTPAEVLERPVKEKRKKQPRRRQEREAVAFKQRITGFKKEIAQRFEQKLTEKEERANEAGADEKKSAQSNSAPSEQSTAGLDAYEEPLQKRRAKKPLVKEFSVFGGFDYQVFDVKDKVGSVAEVGIRTNFLYLLGGIEGVFYHPDRPWLKGFIEGVALSPITEDEQVDSAPALNLALGSVARLEKAKSEVTLFLQRESFNVAVLPEVGGGLKLAQFLVDWAGVQFTYEATPNWSAFFRIKAFLNASVSTEYGDPTGFEATSFGLGSVYDTSHLLKNTKVHTELNFTSFKNSAVLPTEGKGNSLRAYLKWKF